jgi:hypothetical protein
MLGFHSKVRTGCRRVAWGGTNADWPERLLVERGEVWFVDAKLESQEAQTFAAG